jgi:tetratricopeptide (TPR) repeat protein
MIKMLRMQPKYCIFTFVFSVFFLLSNVSQAQKNCEEILNEAQLEFAEGRFFNLPELLKDCLYDAFSTDQKFRAYYILTQAYLVLGKYAEAENSYVMLLKMNPEFVASIERDPVELYYLSKKFTSQPKVSWHANLGVNTSFITTLADVSTYSGKPANTTATRIGIPVVTLGADFNINTKWSVCVETSFSQKVYSTVDKDIFTNDLLARDERSSWVDLPIYLKYQIDSGRVRPFFYAGYALNGLVSSTATLSSTDGGADKSIRIVQGVDVDFTHSRNAFTNSLVVGSGIKFKLPKSFLYVDLRYQMGLNNLVKIENNFYNKDGSLSDAITTYGYVNQLFRMDNLSLRFGYVFSHYNPRKLKTKNLQYFIQKVQWWKKKTPNK